MLLNYIKYMIRQMYNRQNILKKKKKEKKIMSDENQLTAPEQVKQIEIEYQKLNTQISNAYADIHKHEHDALLCLQKLIPIQNAYLSGIIQALQRQVKSQTAELRVYKNADTVSESDRLVSESDRGHADNVAVNVSLPTSTPKQEQEPDFEEDEEQDPDEESVLKTQKEQEEQEV